MSFLTKYYILPIKTIIKYYNFVVLIIPIIILMRAKQRETETEQMVGSTEHVDCARQRCFPHPTPL